MRRPLDADLSHVLDRTEDVFRRLDGQRLLITGGTGFVGRWLLETARHARERLDVSFETVVLSRNPDAFARQAPQLAHDATFVAGDVRTVTASAIGTVDAAIHAATPTDAATNAADPFAVFDIAVGGTRQVLSALGPNGAIPVLLTSSGGVYGRQPEDLAAFHEDFQGGPDALSPAAAYAEGKRASEMLGAISSSTGGPAVVTARLFAFTGAYLPLDTHFAIGNFCRDGLAGRPIVLSGDGRTVRSYLHAADLTVWLWRLLLSGRPGRAYNVGSDDARSLRDVAGIVAAQTGVDVEVQGAAAPVHRYVPDITRARDEIGLSVEISLDDAIGRTLAWHRP